MRRTAGYIVIFENKILRKISRAKKDELLQNGGGQNITSPRTIMIVQS
jgi:hypothetical protein